MKKLFFQNVFRIGLYLCRINNEKANVEPLEKKYYYEKVSSYSCLCAHLSNECLC